MGFAFGMPALAVRVADLGVFGKQMVDGESGVGGDLALVGTFFVVVLVGTFASQVRQPRVEFTFAYVYFFYFGVVVLWQISYGGVFARAPQVCLTTRGVSMHVSEHFPPKTPTAGGTTALARRR